MKKNMIIGVVAVTALFITGCAQEEEVAPEITAITPADGAVNVSKTIAVNVEFNETMHMSSCESRFGLFSGNLENIPANMTGRMDGEFTWNEDQTVMTFHANSALMDSAMYSICLQEGMLSHDAMGEGMMMSGMDGHGMDVAGGIISRFTTGNQGVARIASVSPANGSTGIEGTTEIRIAFDNPMDAASCESRFGLHKGELTEMPMMGMMSGLDGTFHWNSDSTMMTFQPDSVLMDSTLYSICLTEGMQTAGHDGTMMLSDMSDYGNRIDNGISAKFLTK